MDHKQVAQSEVHSRGASFHFVNAQHDPQASSKFSNAQPKHKIESDTPKKISGKKPSSIHHQVASILSQEAHEATEHANKVNTPEAHLAAMSAHHQAGAAHQKATGSVSNKKALGHFDQSMSHLKASKG